MDDKMISEVGKYLKDISSQGFEIYVQGVWASSIVYTLIGLICLALIPFVFKYANRTIDKLGDEGSLDYLDKQIADSIMSFLGLLIIASLLCVGLLLIGTNIIGIFSPEYVAIKELISNIKG